MTDQTEVSAGWGKWRLRMTGIDTPHVLISLLIVITTVIILWDRDSDRRQHERDTTAFLSAHAATHKLLSTVVVNQGIIIGLLDAKFDAMTRQQVEAASVQTYVLTLSPEDRKRLKLDMPVSLFRRTQGVQ